MIEAIINGTLSWQNPYWLWGCGLPIVLWLALKFKAFRIMVLITQKS